MHSAKHSPIVAPNLRYFGVPESSAPQYSRYIRLVKVDTERVEDNDHSGRPSTSKTNQNVSRVKNLQNSDRRMSIRMIADEPDIPQTQVFKIVTGTLAMSVPRSEVSCTARCGNAVSSPLLPRLHLTRLFSVPKNKINARLIEY
ncbi:hypothetical protein TNCV_958011 [Trichonephila clavipes]|nr:hypothetical protein TNCV_958011 [Trichonephila clavipes]